jgi:hypothetical protein
MDFDLFGDDKNKAATTAAPGVKNLKGGTDLATLEKMVKRRRIVLQLHQGFGFATLIALAATVVLGQLNYVDKYGGGNYTNRYDTPHYGLAITSTVLFATDAGLALFAPTPYKKPIKADAALAHKILMGLASVGFLTDIVLGPISVADKGHLNQKNFAIGHLATGYATFACMLGGYLSYVF